MPLFSDLLDMIYPRYCAGCDTLLNTGEVLCLHCLDELPYTNFFRHNDNPVKEIFYGRTDIQYAGCLLFYTKDSLTQRLIFELKYENNQHAGKLLAALMANELSAVEWMHEIDLIIPMPMYVKKERMRGYNQAKIIAQELSDQLNIPLDGHTIIKSVNTDTQTHKTREDRWRSMQNIFEIKNEASLQGKHILLVDDVITTGATLEVCGNEILKIPGTKLSIAAAAYAL